MTDAPKCRTTASGLRLEIYPSTASCPEHRQFDHESDYSDLADEYGLTILKGSEVETEYGHILVFGVTPA